jgi:hypothetical protein
LQRSPQTLAAYFAEVDAAKGESAALDAHVARLKDDLADLTDFEARARDLCDRMATGLQAAALIRAGSPVWPSPLPHATRPLRNASTVCITPRSSARPFSRPMNE